MRKIHRFIVLALVALASYLAVGQQAAQPQVERQRKVALGLQHRTAWDLYLALKKAARGGQQSPPFDRLPDWSGLWTADGGDSFFGRSAGGTSPNLTPAAAATLKRYADLEAQGISYDENLSQCGPPGFPRWLVVPFLREFIVRPEQTWLSSETVNNVRRIYTDGRDHLPVEDRYPLYYGDSIGFWDGRKLVIHTNQLMARSMGRGLPEQSEQMETVEIWEQVDSRRITADVWIYDPTIYVEPWYMQRRYARLSNDDKRLRMAYWHCGENPNNEVYKTKDGSTQFKDFTFDNQDTR